MLRRKRDLFAKQELYDNKCQKGNTEKTAVESSPYRRRGGGEVSEVNHPIQDWIATTHAVTKSKK